MAQPHILSVCKVYQRIDNPKETVCRFPGEPLPKGGAWRYIGSRRLDDWSQESVRFQRPAMRLDELHGRETVTPDFIHHMHQPEKRKPAAHSAYFQKLLHETKKRLEKEAGGLPEIPPHGDQQPKRRLLSPKEGLRIQEGPLHFWGSDANPQSFHL